MVPSQTLGRKLKNGIRLSFSERKTRTLTCLGISHERFPLVMSVLNVTPDSFSDGGRFHHRCDKAVRLLCRASDIIDIHGESTRPGSEPVTLEDEWRRVKMHRYCHEIPRIAGQH